MAAAAATLTSARAHAGERTALPVAAGAAFLGRPDTTVTNLAVVDVRALLPWRLVSVRALSRSGTTRRSRPASP